MENKTDALLEKLTKKKTEKVIKKIKQVDGTNPFLFGLKGNGSVKYDREISKLFSESDDTSVNKLGRISSIGFCTPCTIQKEVSGCHFFFVFVLFTSLISL